MKKSLIKLISALLIAASFGSIIPVAVSANTIVSAPADDDIIKVFIDGEAVKFDVDPIAQNGRTMVPLRAVFEYFGANVAWSQNDNSVTAKCGYLDIKLRLNDPVMYINNNAVTLDTAPTAQNGRTLVPLRAVAEAFSADVSWDGSTNNVYIRTKYPKSQYQDEAPFDEYHIRTSDGITEYMDFTLDGSLLTIKGKLNSLAVNRVFLKLGDRSLNWRYSAYVDDDSTFTFLADLDEFDMANEEALSIYTGKQNENVNWAYTYRHIYIKKTAGGYVFKKPLAYDYNESFNASVNTPVGYIDTDITPELQALSDVICADADSDYLKLLKIHDWVAENIYYDYDHYEGRSNTVYFRAADVYREKRTVCEGYARLTAALAHAQGIPCRVVSGVSTKNGWTEESYSATETNHAWNQAYVNGRWINLDVTWNTDNEYRNGQFIYGGIFKRLYFDISDVMLAYTHKAIKIK